jgi:hypothetical protein
VEGSARSLHRRDCRRPRRRPSLAMLKRIGTLAATLPADDWDGVWRLDQK